MDPATYLVVMLIACGVTASLAKPKNRSALAWGALGALMPLIAIILVVNLPALPAPAPAASAPVAPPPVAGV